MNATIEITSVKEVKGFIHSNSIYAENPNRYNGNRLVSRSYEPKALYIEGIIDGAAVKFYSPTIVITVTTGFLNHKTMNKNNWFRLIEGKQNSYRGAKMFDGGDTPNVAIETECEIIPTIKTGDKVDINYNISDNGKIKRVKLLQIL